MFSLPLEVQLDILKCLDFNQIFSVKQTNFYFRNLINKYEGELCFRIKFSELLLIDYDHLLWLRSYKFIEPQSGIFEFTLNRQLKKKWKRAISKSIPLYEYDRNLILCIKTVDTKPHYVLKLPNIPKNIEEMIIIRCWLERLFKCAFEYAHFDKCVFNPEMLNILFYTNKTLKFNIKRPYISSNNEICGNKLGIILDHLIIFRISCD
uniref:F-box domain-containing protein n=1 Tax=Meloidogyne enterolobii TaxID=390850 RepID=A0A6V7Y6R7_MELEN|nr:unnamed protein product [Meloidogyne enterolobii]